MALDKDKIAAAIQDGLGFASETTSGVTEKVAEAIVAHLQTGIVNFLPATITGTAPPSGGPLTGGAGQGGIITLVPAAFVPLLINAFGTASAEIQNFGTTLSAQFMTAIVEYQTGSVTGTCSNTPTSPGALIGEAQGGVLSNMQPSSMATAIASAIGQTSASDQISSMCEKLVEAIQSDAEVSHLTGTVIATISAGGGPIIAGAATGGTIA